MSSPKQTVKTRKWRADEDYQLLLLYFQFKADPAYATSKSYLPRGFYERVRMEYNLWTQKKMEGCSSQHIVAFLRTTSSITLRLTGIRRTCENIIEYHSQQPGVDLFDDVNQGIRKAVIRNMAYSEHHIAHISRKVFDLYKRNAHIEQRKDSKRSSQPQQFESQPSPQQQQPLLLQQQLMQQQQTPPASPEQYSAGSSTPQQSPSYISYTPLSPPPMMMLTPRSSYCSDSSLSSPLSENGSLSFSDKKTVKSEEVRQRCSLAMILNPA
ncbi:hypothetical protein BZA70DRAFT_274349 [Myxozyma melibiosi]|uniref:Clr5 domain-containing protein n=1 Tax=Myxozyma melibiosi TaxID=54550 RepID=A0ABR1F9H3_9ASCO